MVVIRWRAVETFFSCRGAVTVSVPCLSTLGTDYGIGGAIVFGMGFIGVAIKTDLKVGEFF